MSRSGWPPKPTSLVTANSPNVEILLLAHRLFAWLEVGEVDLRCRRWRSWPRRDPGRSTARRWCRCLSCDRCGVDESTARAVLDRWADALKASSPDSEWLTMLAQVGDLCFRLGGHELAPWLYDTLTPYADLWSVDGIAAYVHGPVHRQLGVLAATLGRTDEAAHHFEAALAGNRRAGAELLAARTLLDRGQALEDRAALELARTAYAQLGIERRVAEVDGLLGLTPSSRGANRWSRQGDVWVLRFADRESHCDSKGMRDLHRLVEATGREVAAIDLVQGGEALRQGGTGDTIDARSGRHTGPTRRARDGARRGRRVR